MADKRWIDKAKEKNLYEFTINYYGSHKHHTGIGVWANGMSEGERVVMGLYQNAYAGRIETAEEALRVIMNQDIHFSLTEMLCEHPEMKVMDILQLYLPIPATIYRTCAIESEDSYPTALSHTFKITTRTTN